MKSFGLSLFLFLLSFSLYSQVGEDYIITFPLEKDTICPGSSFNLTATAKGHFLEGNVFYAELSDFNGDFMIPDTVGFLAYSNSSSEIFQVDVPVEIPRLYGFGTLYRMRVVSSSPALVGNDNGFNITIDNFPLITIEGDSYACLGETTIFTANDVVETLLWSVDGGEIIGNANEESVMVLWNSVGNYTLTLSYESALGCASSASLEVVVSEKPNAIIFGNDVVCVNDEKEYFALDNSSTDYEWIVIGGEIVRGAASDTVLVNWNVIGDGWLILNQSNNGCTASDTMRVDVAPNPFPEITGKEIVCENSIEEYSTFGDNLSFYWTVEGGTILDSELEPVITVLWGNYGVGKVTLKQINYASCVGYQTLDVLIESKPSPEIAGESNVCYNNYQRYKTATNSNTNEWFIEGGEISQHISDNEIEVFWNGFETGLVTLIQTNYADCKDTVSKEITINPLPTPEIYGDAYFCQYSTAQYVASVIPGFNNKWFVQGGEIIEQISNDTVIVQWNESEDVYISLTQTTINGCKDSVILPISIVPYPEVEIEGRLSVCTLQEATYSTTKEDANISWEVTGGTIEGADNLPLLTVIWDAPGEGSVKLKKSMMPLGCADSNTITVEIFPMPEPPTITREEDLLKSSYESGNQWFFGFDEQELIEGADSQYYAPLETGYYSVQHTDEIGCTSDLSELFYFEILSVKDDYNNSNIEIYPNPVKNKLNILSKQDYNNVEISIINILGETVYFAKNVHLQKNSALPVELNNYSTGIYIVQIKQKDLIYSGKIVVE